MIGELSRVFMENVLNDPVLQTKYTLKQQHMSNIIRDLIYLMFYENDADSRRDLKHNQMEIGMTKPDVKRCSDCMDKALASVNMEKCEREKVRKSIDTIENTLMSTDNINVCDTKSIIKEIKSHINGVRNGMCQLDTDHMLRLLDTIDK